MTSHPSASSSALDARQAVLAIVLGVVFWYAAAVLVWWLAPQGALEGGTRALTYALVVPGTWPVVLLIAALGRLTPPQIVPALALTTAVALLCDGVATAWYPALYAADDGHVRLCAAVIEWGAGVGIVLAFLEARRRV